MQNGKPNDNNPYRKTCIQVNTVRGPLEFLLAEGACTGVKISTGMRTQTKGAVGRLLKRGRGRFYSWVEKKGRGPPTYGPGHMPGAQHIQPNLIF